MIRGIKWFAWFALVSGIVLMVGAISQLAASNGAIPSGLSCRSLCGFSLIVAELLGAEAGKWTFAALELALGAVSAAVGVKFIRQA